MVIFEGVVGNADITVAGARGEVNDLYKVGKKMHWIAVH